MDRAEISKMVWLALAGAIGFLIWYKYIKPLGHFTRMGVKQTNPWPFFGDQWLVIFKRWNFSQFVTWAYNKFPNSRYSGCYQFSTPILILRDPELIKQLTVKDFDYFTDRRSFLDPEIDPLWGNNLAVMKGQPWREMRATLTGSFTSSKMKHMFGLMNEAAENFVKFFSDKQQEVQEVEMKDTYTRYTNDMIATTAFGLKVDSLEDPNNPFYLMGKKISHLWGVTFVLKFFCFFLLPRVFKWLKIRFFDKHSTNYFRDIIHETIRARDEKGIVRPDMINLLMDARKGAKQEEKDTGSATVKESAHINKFMQLKSLTNDDITSQALVFFIAGFDTISTALSFESYELALNKDVQDKLRVEIAKTHKACNGELTYDILQKMTYLDMVVSEMLRKWPPASFIDRLCTRPYTIQPVRPDEKPVHLKVGDALWLPIHALHRDPEYFPDPEKFNPERFSDENKDSIKPYTYVPFGSGPRICIGNRFALLEAKALLYHLLLNFEIVPIKRTPIPLKLGSTLVNLNSNAEFWLGFKHVN